jgi:hypothetical protein
MILHASNSLAGSQSSRESLWRFNLFLGGGLTFLLGLLAHIPHPPVSQSVIMDNTTLRYRIFEFDTK